MKRIIDRLEVGFAHAVGAALRAVLGLLPRQVAAPLAELGNLSGRWQRAPGCIEQRNRDTARLGQLHAGNSARSARYGLEGIGPENHGMRS